MKIATFIATTLLAVTALATSTVYHDYDGALRGIALNNACITADQVRTISATKNCVKLVPVTHGNGGEEGTWTDWVCQKWETSQLAYPRAFTRTVCAQYSSGNGEADNMSCLKWVQKADFLPATIKVGTMVDHGGEAGASYGPSYNHTFPACK